MTDVRVFGRMLNWVLLQIKRGGVRPPTPNKPVVKRFLWRGPRPGNLLKSLGYSRACDCTPTSAETLRHVFLQQINTIYAALTVCTNAYLRVSLATGLKRRRLTYPCSDSRDLHHRRSSHHPNLDRVTTTPIVYTQKNKHFFSQVDVQ